MRCSLARALSAIFLLIIYLPAYADTLTPDEMEQMMRDRYCPAENQTYRQLTYREHCGKNYEKEMTNREAVDCQKQGEKMNAPVHRFNNHLIVCRGIGKPGQQLRY